jgi:hypothetical protein
MSRKKNTAATNTTSEKKKELPIKDNHKTYRKTTRTQRPPALPCHTHSTAHCHPAALLARVRCWHEIAWAEANDSCRFPLSGFLLLFLFFFWTGALTSNNVSETPSLFHTHATLQGADAHQK